MRRAPIHALVGMDFSTLAAATESFSPANKIGAGATGEVFKGVINGSHPVAVKCLNLPAGSSPDAERALLRRFQTEADILLTLRHPRVVHLLGYAIDDSNESVRPYALVFELLEGGSVADHLHRTAVSTDALDAGQRVDIALGASIGIGYLHGLREAGQGEGAPTVPVLHRDIKSANIGLAKSADGTYFAKLLDCGLAKALLGPQGGGGAGAARPTTGVVQGTPGYMAPELVADLASVQSDIYSFGVVLLELLMGQLVEPSTALQQHLRADDDGSTACIEALADAVWPKEAVGPMAQLIADCIQLKVKKRPADMAEVRTSLLAIRQLVATPAQSMAPCPSCLSSVPEKEGVRCAGGKDGRAERHFMCFGCLQEHVPAVSTPEALRRNNGGVACPEVGCESPPWMLEELLLDTGALQAYALGVRRHAFDAPKAKREAEETTEARQAAILNGAASLEDRKQVARLHVVERILTTRCPRCEAAFLDFNGCNCLECANCGAGFCACCLEDCGSRDDTHAHYQAAHPEQYALKGFFDTEFFESCGKARCVAELVAYLRTLHDKPELQAALLDELAKADLVPLGIIKEEVEEATERAEQRDRAAAAATAGLNEALAANPVVVADVERALSEIAQQAAAEDAEGPLAASSARQALAAAGASDAVLRSLTKEGLPATVVASACNALASIVAGADASASQIREALMAAGAVDCLVAALKSHQASEIVLGGFAEAVVAMATEPYDAALRASVQQAFFATEGVKGLVHGMRALDLPEETLGVALCAMARVAKGSDTDARDRRQQLTSLRAAEILAEGLKAYPGSLAVFEGAVEAVSVLAAGRDDIEEHAARQPLIDAGVMKSLLRGVNALDVSKRTAVRLCNAIRDLAGTGIGARRRCAAMLRVGAVEALTRMVSMFPESQGTQEAAAHALVGLAPAHREEDVVLSAWRPIIENENAAMTSLLEALLALDLTERAAVRVCTSIDRIGGGGGFARLWCRLLLDARAANVLTSALSVHPDSASVFEAAISVVGRFVNSADDDTCTPEVTALSDAGTLGAAIQGLAFLELPEAVTAKAWGVLFKVCYKGRDQTHKLIVAGVAECMKRSLDAHPTSSAVFSAVVSAATELLLWYDEAEVSAPEAFVESGAIVALMHGVATAPDLPKESLGLVGRCIHAVLCSEDAAVGDWRRMAVLEGVAECLARILPYITDSIIVKDIISSIHVLTPEDGEDGADEAAARQEFFDAGIVEILLHGIETNDEAFQEYYMQNAAYACRVIACIIKGTDETAQGRRQALAAAGVADRVQQALSNGKLEQDDAAAVVDALHG